MKKEKLILLFLLGFQLLQAQEITDVLRYSQPNAMGTARYRAMSGAFGALGGDLAAIGSNPASSVIFNNNQLGLSLNNSLSKTTNNYFGTKNSRNQNNFEVNQLGGVFVFEKGKESSKINKFSIGFNYDNLNNFDDSMTISGQNTRSIDNYFLNYADGIKLGVLQDYNFEDLTFSEQQAYLGYNSYIIDPIPLASDPLNYNNPNISQYSSAVISGSFYQKNTIVSTGYNGKLAFNGAVQIHNKLSLGVNLNYHFTDYKKVSNFFESNSNNTTADTYIKRIYFDNELHTSGSGFSAQIGAIYKVVNSFRLGIALETPTWIELTDELLQGVSAVSGNNVGELAADVARPQTTMVYEPYTIRTPGKITTSAAVVFGKIAILSVDWGTKDYRKMQLRPDKDFANQNNQTTTLFQRAYDLKIGGELKLKKWSLRAGHRFEQSPYKNENFMGDLTGYSGGLGYNLGGTKIDFAFSTSKRDYGYQMFYTGLTDMTKITSKSNNATVTVTFEL